MRLLICALLLTGPAVLAAVQEKDKWRRVYTFEDSTVEINTRKVIFSTGSSGRVLFRTLWSKAQKVRGRPDVKLKSQIETIEFKCAEHRYRTLQVLLFDPKEKQIDARESDPSTTEWKELRRGSTMLILFEAACSLLAEKRRSP